MNKILVLIFLLITQSLSQVVNIAYQKMKKGHGFDDDICAYTYNDITYVKPCKEGQFCKDHVGLSKCTDIETKIYPKYLGQECSNHFECDNGLFCSGTCQYSCPLTTQEPIKTYNGGYACRTVAKKHIIYEADTSNINTYNLITGFNENSRSLVTNPLSYHQVLGKISFFSQTDSSANRYGTIYKIGQVESAYIGTVPDGEFVGDRLACKSGFALYFYPDKNLNDPCTDPFNHNSMYLMCVTLNDVDINNKMIKYNGDNIYNLNKNVYYQEIDVDGTINSRSPGNAESLILGRTPLSDLVSLKEIFEKYIGVFTKEKQEECEKQKNYEQYTCEDDEVRKWSYFLDHPGDYVIYYDKEEKDNDITNYLLQTTYRTFVSGSFIYSKFLISFIMFLFL